MIAGRWELLEPIGSGGTSVVWRAHDHRLGRPCAAKLLKQRDAGEILRFAREQSRRLVGSHVVAPYAWAADDETAVIAFELVTGGSLRALIGDYGGLSDGTVVTIVDQLLDALDDVHRAGIVHRDVKPANVLLRATGNGPLNIALTDFGIAASAHEGRLTQAGFVIGTPGYVPPEVLHGDAIPAAHQDLYALGRVAVALVLGHEDGTPEQAVEVVEDPSLARAISAMTHVDPSLRPHDVGQARALLADAARDTLPRGRDGESVTVFDHVPSGPDEREEPEPLAALPLQAAPTLVASQPNDIQVPEPEFPVVEPVFVEPPVPVSRKRALAKPVAAGLVIVGGLSFGAVIWANLGDGGARPTQAGTPTPTGGVSTPDASVTPSSSASPTAPTTHRERGDACTWQVEGDFATAEDGTKLRCQRIDGAYTWQPE